MRNVTALQIPMKTRKNLSLLLLAAVVVATDPTGLGQAHADPGAAPNEAGALIGAWCDDTGYRIDLAPDSITFLDAQAPNPPPGEELALAAGIAVYTQDFRTSAWPELDVVSCTLRLTGPDRAEETCSGPGIGYRPFIKLARCTTLPIS